MEQTQSYSSRNILGINSFWDLPLLHSNRIVQALTDHIAEYIPLETPTWSSGGIASIIEDVLNERPEQIRKLKLFRFGYEARAFFEDGSELHICQELVVKWF